MKTQTVWVLGLMSALVHSNAFAAQVEYSCTSRKIDESASYYLSKYLVSLDTSAKRATIKDGDGNLVSDDAIKLKKFSSSDDRLDGAFRGMMWSDGGCSVDVYMTPEMMSGEEHAFMKVKQESECRGPGAWLSCQRVRL